MAKTLEIPSISLQRMELEARGYKKDIEPDEAASLQTATMSCWSDDGRQHSASTWFFWPQHCRATRVSMSEGAADSKDCATFVVCRKDAAGYNDWRSIGWINPFIHPSEGHGCLRAEMLS